jgi:RNA polymerase sigma-70 factor (ECF subfamily)
MKQQPPLPKTPPLIHAHGPARVLPPVAQLPASSLRLTRSARLAGTAAANAPGPAVDVADERPATSVAPQIDHEPAAPGAAPVSDDLSVCSTVDLLERARAGNDTAFEIVFRRCVRGLRRFAAGRLPAQCRGMNDTEDLVQDTVIRALHHLDGFEFRHEGALLAYLRQSMLHRIVDEVRKTNRRPLAVTLGDEHVDQRDSPLESAIGRQNVDRYERALSSLRARDRAAIVLRLEQQAEYEDLAVQLGMPSANAARVAVKRALYRLAQQMVADAPRRG